MQQIKSNYPRSSSLGDKELVSAFSNSVLNSVFLLVWFCISWQAWFTFASTLFNAWGKFSDTSLSYLLASFAFMLTGNFLFSNIINLYAVSRGEPRWRIHLMVVFGNLLGFGFAGFVVLYSGIFGRIRQIIGTRGRGLTRRELFEFCVEKDVAPTQEELRVFVERHSE